MKKHSRHSLPGFISLCCVCLLSSACQQEKATAKAVIPSVKYIVAHAQASGQTRQFSGQIQAAEQVSLSFGVSGQVNELLVDIGDQVVEGQLIAKLDQRSYRLNLDSSMSKLNAARASVKDAKIEYQRQQKLYAKQLIAISTLENSKTLLSNAETQLIVAQNDVHQAKQDIEKTHIKAPFNAVISKRNIDRLAEVAGNTEIVELASDNSFQIQVMVPESIIRFVQYQQTIKVILPSQNGLILSAEVNEIAASSSSGNAYAVTAQFNQSNTKLRAGMSAKALFFFANKEHKEAFLVPISAVSTRDAAVAEHRRGQPAIPLYIIDANTSKARLIWVTGDEAVANELEVIAGLNDGDKVITAGVAFIKDGMHVRPWQAK